MPGMPAEPASQMAAEVAAEAEAEAWMTRGTSGGLQ